MITADHATRRARAGSQALSERYSSRIIKAGALLADTKTLLAHWDPGISISDNLGRVRRENLFGKASRSRVEDILAIFRQRYLGEESVARALIALVKPPFPGAALDRILYFHAARSDRLLRDTVVDILVPMKARGIAEIDVMDLQRVLTAWVAEGRTAGRWSESTTTRVAQGLLSTLRDFGVLQGEVRKRIAPAYLPVEALAYVAFCLKQQQPSGARLIDSPDWTLFFLPREGVERFLFEAHQRGLLEYHAAGSVTRLGFPAANLEEYAHVLADRAH
jgi:hypothetical protein